MTVPSAERLLLIFVPSFTLSAVAFYLSYLSEPAKSTNDILLFVLYLVSTFTVWIIIVKIICDLEETSLSSVLKTLRDLMPVSKAFYASAYVGI